LCGCAQYYADAAQCEYDVTNAIYRMHNELQQAKLQPRDVATVVNITRVRLLFSSFSMICVGKISVLIHVFMHKSAMIFILTACTHHPSLLQSSIYGLKCTFYTNFLHRTLLVTLRTALHRITTGLFIVFSSSLAFFFILLVVNFCWFHAVDEVQLADYSSFLSVNVTLLLIALTP